MRRQQPYSSPDAGPIVIGIVKCTNCCPIYIPSYNGPNSSVERSIYCTDRISANHHTNRGTGLVSPERN